MSIVAWLHKDRQVSDVITARVKLLWEDAWPQLVEYYTEPLVLASELTAATDELAKLRAENEALRKDAERYLHLRNAYASEKATLLLIDSRGLWKMPDQMDKDIDAAIAEQKC